jgi:hypothetical protein
MIEEIEREEIYDFLEQSGVRGMHWGVRKASDTTPSPGFKNRTTKQKATIIGTAAVMGLAGAMVSKYAPTPIKALSIGSFAAAGGASAALIIDQHGKNKVDAPKSKIKNPPKPPKQTKAEKKVASRAEGQKRATDLFNAAAENPDRLVLLNGRQIVTGKEFIDHMVNGGVMDVNTTMVYDRREE